MTKSPPSTFDSAASAATSSVRAVLDRIHRAQNAHDAVALAACFAADYRSEQPAHPARAFHGAQRVREHWEKIFHEIPDLRAETLHATAEGDTVWAECRWFGHKRDGADFEVRGVMVLGIHAGKVAWGRLYMEPVDLDGKNTATAIQRATG